MMYYKSGGLKELQQYTNEIKSGDWYSFNEFGAITNITTYRKGKQIKQKTTTLLEPTN